MKVIGSGFGRTGTLSLKAALEILGFDPCYHMMEVIKRPSHVRLWQKISHGDDIPWERIFDKFEATVDYPASPFYRELLDRYPDAKVVHTVRDPERWYNSTAETIYRVNNTFPEWVTAYTPLFNRFYDMQQRLIWQKVFNGRFLDRPYAIQTFNQYTDAVREHVPSEKLLIFNVKEGWEPLCAFLEVPVPDVPFPHVNDRETMRRRLGQMRFIFTWLPIGLVAATTVIGLRKLMLRLRDRPSSKSEQSVRLS